ncbi:hypothetical protein AB1L30_18015 [Bremerella sp. JC817]|uniref:McrC family protein n=1 Tax=Bremerella sp. JC817 TaxID=3231756 RepID=UPI0034585809
MKVANVLTLREHETARIGPEWNPAAKMVTGRDAAKLEHLQRQTGQKVFEIGRHAIKASNFAGTISLGNRAIEVLPKTDLSNDQTRRRLIEMLTVAQMIPFREVDIAPQASRAGTLLDIFMLVYLRHLTTEWRRGRVANYRKVDANRSCLKGKLLFAEHVRRNVAHAERFYTRCDSFTVDVPLSQTLKLATNVCRRYAMQHSIGQEALSLLMEFDEVSDVRFSPQQLALINTDRQNERFSSILSLGKSLILGESPDRTAATSTFSLMFDMNAVFERYIAGLMKRAIGSDLCRVTAQMGGEHLLQREGKGQFSLRPDIGVHEKGRLICLVDTKWKLLDPSKPHDKVSQADMYQMYAYAKEFACPRVILLYPCAMMPPGHLATYHIENMDGPRIEVRTVDIAEPPTKVVTQLQSFFAT